MPALPAVDSVKISQNGKKETAPSKHGGLAAIARAREAGAAWAELAADCADVLAAVKGQLAALRATLDSYRADLEVRVGNPVRPAYALLRSDRKALIAAISALERLDAATRAIRDREAREAKRATERAEKRVRSRKPSEARQTMARKVDE